MGTNGVKIASVSKNYGQVEALQEEELRKLEAERGGLDPDADPGAEEAADLS